MRRLFLCCFLFIVVGMVLVAEPRPKATATTKATATHTDPSIADGEKRYRANCARCHQAPPKFAPAAMGTLVRHMRVRAMITDQDMHAILKYMTQ